MPSFSNFALPLGPDLTVGSIRAEDADELVTAFEDPELRRWLPLPSPYTHELATSWCTDIARELRESGRGVVVAVRRGRSLIASIDAKRVDWRARTLELSYWTAPAHRGQGVMSSAVRTVADHLLRVESFERVELRIAAANHASLRVAEKAGFVREGAARNAGFTDSGRTDLVIHSLIRGDLSS